MGQIATCMILLQLCIIQASQNSRYYLQFTIIQLLKQLSKRHKTVSVVFARNYNMMNMAQFEHFRPKAGYKINRKDKLKKPGYYWLGYSWSNLFFVCGPCNTKKGNIFPLENESRRAKNHNFSWHAEKPLLLDPAGSKKSIESY